MQNHKNNKAVLEMMDRMSKSMTPTINKMAGKPGKDHVEVLAAETTVNLTIRPVQEGYKIRLTSQADDASYKLCATYDSNSSAITKAFFYGGKESYQYMKNQFDLFDYARQQSEEEEPVQVKKSVNRAVYT